MKKCILPLLILILLVAGCGKIETPDPRPEDTEFSRSREFHEKYKLTAVVVFSRHNIRAPQAAPESFISRVTPYKWHDFGVGKSELTAKGGVLETINGEFFRKWLVSENLFRENAEPAGDEIYVLANSLQRTIATADCFIKGFMPGKDIPVHHKSKEGTMDPEFLPGIGNDITDSQLALMAAEYEPEYNAEGIRKASMALQPNYDLLSDIIDLKDSPAYKDGEFTGFNNHDSEIILRGGPKMTASIEDACTIADALILQYYEESDPQKEAFGKKLTTEQWRMVSGIIAKRDGIRYYSPSVQLCVSQCQRDLIADALQAKGRKFTFFCGHDTNIHNILKAMRVVEYDTPDAIETGIPIGSKIVFEKWTDAEGNDFIGVDHVYQTVEQLRGNIPLDLARTPHCIRLQFEGLPPNKDGLFTLGEMIDLLEEKSPYDQQDGTFLKF